MSVVGQVAAVTKNLASVMEMVDAGNWVVFNKEGGSIITMTKNEDEKLRKILGELTGTMVPIDRKGNDFIVHAKVKSEEDADGYMKQKKPPARRMNNRMDVDHVKIGNKYGLLTQIDEENYESYMCQPCNGASAFGRP